MASADYAEGKLDRPPMPLRYAWQASSHNRLPNEGSLRDQPAKLMSQMNISYSVYRAFKDFINSDLDPKWIKKHEDEWKIIQKVNAMRKIRDENSELSDVDMRTQVRENFKKAGIVSYVIFEVLKLDL